MNKPIRTTAPNGDPIVILSAAEYDRLVTAAEDIRDGRIADAALAEHRANPSSSLTTNEMMDLLAAPTPIHFWRRKRGLSQAKLAEMAGCSQPYLNNLEAGKRAGTIATMKKIAAALDLTIGQLDDGKTTG